MRATRRGILTGLLLAGLVTTTVTGLAGPAPAAHAAQQSGGSLANGQSVTATVGTPGDSVAYTFAVTAGRHADFTVTSSSWSTADGALLSWYRPDGSLLDQCAVSSGAKECDIVPDVTGTWTIAVEPSDTSTGQVTFTYRTDETGGALKAGKAVRTTLARGGLDAVYTFKAVEGRPVMFTVSSATFSSGTTGYLFFYGPGPTALFSHCVAKAGAECRIIPSKTGTWQVTVSAGSGTGTATFSCWPDLNQGYLTRYQTFTTKLTHPHQNATYTFPADKDQRTKLYVTATRWTEGAVVRLWIFPLSGTPLINSCTVTKKTLCTLVPTTTSHWRMEVDPQGGAVGSITMRRTQ
jgi:hypothetical protein